MPEKKTMEKAKRDVKEGKSPTTAWGVPSPVALRAPKRVRANGEVDTVRQRREGVGARTP